MDDRIAEIREALEGLRYAWQYRLSSTEEGLLEVVVAAARAYADLLDSVEEDRRAHPYWAEGYKSGEDDGVLSGYDQGFRAGLQAGMASLNSDALIIRRADIDYEAAKGQIGKLVVLAEEADPLADDWGYWAKLIVDSVLASSQGVEP